MITEIDASRNWNYFRYLLVLVSSVFSMNSCFVFQSVLFLIGVAKVLLFFDSPNFFEKFFKKIFSNRFSSNNCFSCLNSKHIKHFQRTYPAFSYLLSGLLLTPFSQTGVQRYDFFYYLQIFLQLFSSFFNSLFAKTSLNA